MKLIELLYFIDIINKKIYIFNSVTKIIEQIQLAKEVGSIALTDSSNAIIALEDGIYLLDLKTKTTTIIDEITYPMINNRFNDGKCDADGRFWVGTTNKSFIPNRAALYCLNRKMNLVKKLDKVSISNGITWSINNKYMYYIDTLTKSVIRFDYNLLKGEIHNKSEVINFSNESGLPDGMTIDVEGMLWIAHWVDLKYLDGILILELNYSRLNYQQYM